MASRIPVRGYIHFLITASSVLSFLPDLRLQFVLLPSASFRSLARESGAPKPGNRYHSPHDDEIALLGNSGPCQGNLIDFIPCYKAQHKHLLSRVSMTGTSRRNFVIVLPQIISLLKDRRDVRPLTQLRRLRI